MKNVRIACVAMMILAGMIATVSAGEHVSGSTLDSMGLAGLRVLSDNDGLAVRGRGTSASVWGSSTASFLGQTSTNGYKASAEHRHDSSFAAGANISVAGVVVGGASNHGFIVFGAAGFAGGASIAVAK